MKKNILFICTGNTCRSPMAEALFRRLLRQEGLHHEYECSSAGVYAFEGDSASGEAIEALVEYQLDISKHYSKTLSIEMVRNAYLLLTMTYDHKRMILDVYPEAADKIYTLKEFAEYHQGDWDISDPYGLNEEVYLSCAEEIEETLFKILDKL